MEKKRAGQSGTKNLEIWGQSNARNMLNGRSKGGGGKKIGTDWSRRLWKGKKAGSACSRLERKE